MLESSELLFRHNIMATSQPLSPAIRFGSFELDANAAELRKNGTLIRLQPQPLKVLLLLTQHAGQVVTREEIQRCLWSDSTFVDFERGINFSINQIRGALADNAEKPRYIETLPRRGYRFIAEVSHETSTIEGPTVHAYGAAVGHISAGRDDANPSPTSESIAPVSPHVSLATMWSRRKIILAVVTTAIVFLGFAGFALYRRASGRPRISLENLQIGKLTDEGKVAQLAISPDGRYVAYAERDSLESGLRIRQVDTRSEEEILVPDRSRASFLGLTFSPDGNSIYYVQSNKNGGGFNFLYKVPLMGGPPRLLGKYADTTVSFSPNGQQFAFTEGRSDLDILELRIANADGSGDRLLASIPAGDANNQYGPAWSPDGKTIAVPVMLRGEKVRWALDAVSVADGSVRELYSYAHEIGRAVWLPEGDAVLMRFRDQAGSGQLWAIPYPRGKPVRLTTDLENYEDFIDITRVGKKVAAIATKQTSNVWILPNGDAARGRQITTSAVPLTQVVWTPLGKLLTQSADGQMWLMKSDGSERMHFTTARQASSPAACGQFIVFDSLHEDTTDLVRVDADGLNPARLFRGNIGQPSCSPDGHYVFFSIVLMPNRILRISLEGGNPIEIARSLGYYMQPRLSISPDGTLLAYAYDLAPPAIGTKLAVIPVNGGAPLQTFKLPTDASDLRWSPDGRRLQYLLTSSGVTNIWEQALSGGEPKQFTQFTSGRIFGFDWSADGKRLLLARGDTSSDVVLISNFR
jgi:DNA-binding winged helix-turn-helix (wHTH) protein/Tol biopolymer transport system component